MLLALCLPTLAQADALDDFINRLPATESASTIAPTPKPTAKPAVPQTTLTTDPTPVALNPIARLQEVALSAISFVGKPYVYGSSNPDVGFDCSGLVQYVLAQSGVKKLPRTSAEMYAASSPIRPEDLVVGDLLFFDNRGGVEVNHVGIYVGEGRFIHAPSSGGFVRLDRLSKTYWRKALIAGRRVLKLD